MLLNYCPSLFLDVVGGDAEPLADNVEQPREDVTHVRQRVGPVAIRY